ncbi:unnamed protein product [Cuscuta campestris]|uniref:F-box domain-containing protein n=1 Tax=Cuscuta campestris TaxID=132261 RepID=A0A484LCG6_9ASTE|nr:unnamed protein product [Cuscuta campestris]
MEGCPLSTEILIEIFARLPVNSLLRFKCVCKFMYSMIKHDHHFHNKHYEISRAKRDCVIFERDCEDSPSRFSCGALFSSVYRDSDSGEMGCADLNMPSPFVRFVKCADGVLCLVLDRFSSSERFFDFLIWNPSTRETKALPSIKTPEDYPMKLDFTFGFGFSNEMVGKVVVVWSSTDQSPETRETVLVCNQVGDSWGWRQIESFPHIQDEFCVDNSADFYSQGKYYWCLLMYPDQKPAKEYLLWFDIGDEVFGLVGLPDKPLGGYGNWGRKCVWTGDGIIALICHRENLWEVWFLKESNNNNNSSNNVGWHKEASFDISRKWIEWFPMKIWNLKRDLLISGWCLDDCGGITKFLVSIDLVTREKRVIDNICAHSGVCVAVYSESLKLL